VLALVRRRDGSAHGLVVAATRTYAAAWDVDGLAQSPWVSDAPGRWPGPGPAIAARMLIAGLTLVPGAVPRGIASVRLTGAGAEDRAIADPATGAFLAVLPGDIPDAVRLVSLDDHGAEQGAPLLIAAPPG
jgi:hypothetical protein